eukprot:351958-Chlamydomonas_euryale.AAC.5
MYLAIPEEHSRGGGARVWCSLEGTWPSLKEFFVAKVSKRGPDIVHHSSREGGGGSRGRGPRRQHLAGGDCAFTRIPQPPEPATPTPQTAGPGPRRQHLAGGRRRGLHARRSVARAGNQHGALVRSPRCGRVCGGAVPVHPQLRRRAGAAGGGGARSGVWMRRCGCVGGACSVGLYLCICNCVGGLGPLAVVALAQVCGRAGVDVGLSVPRMSAPFPRVWASG